MIGYAELLKNHECDRELQEQALDYILEEGKRLNSITRKMIKLSRIQPGPLEHRAAGRKKDAGDIADGCEDEGWTETDSFYFGYSGGYILLW
ncbi:MAG: histidine kinase dimerization/phospho-acceptor domain-containing protein [Enterocloster sp.]